MYDIDKEKYMAIITEGINGPVVGRLGNVVFYRVKGQNRARSLPRVTKRKRKPSPEQAAQRAKFKLMQEWLRPMKGLVRIGFGRYSPPKTGHNIAMSYNMRHAILDHDGEFSVDPAAFRFSAGPLTSPANAELHLGDGTVRFTWDKPGAEAGLGNARTLLLVYNTTNSLCKYEICGARAHSGADELTLQFTKYIVGDVCHAYMAFMNVETGDVSDSVYAGMLPGVIE